MAFLGNIVGAYAAQQIGEYNAQLYSQQAAYADAKAAQQRTAYNQLDRPRLVKQQQRDYSDFFVSSLLSGAEFSGSAFDTALDFQVNQALDLSIADYNESIEYDEARNQSLLLQSRAEGERYRGQLTAGVQLAKAGGTLLGDLNI
tara:strand:+ start:59 stop:493 length:435 start_codon:yes stop_codon:yes gene_type:complete